MVKGITTKKNAKNHTRYATLTHILRKYKPTAPTATMITVKKSRVFEAVAGHFFSSGIVSPVLLCHEYIKVVVIQLVQHEGR